MIIFTKGTYFQTFLNLVISMFEFPYLENYDTTNKGNKSSKRLEVRLYCIALAYFLKILPSVVIIV